VTGKSPTRGSSDGSDGHTLQEHVRDYIMAAIGRGEIKPGQRIKQRDIAAEVGVSVTPVREALRELQAMGVVDFSAHHGATVRNLEIADVIEINRIAESLLPLLAELTAERITTGEIDRAEQVCILLEATRDWNEYAALNKVFHSALTRGAKSPRLEAILTQDRVLSERLICASLSAINRRPEQANIDHRELLEALRDRDSDHYLAVSRRHQRPFAEFIEKLGAEAGPAGFPPGR
jgi:DNA-binding GntR family transcriptional regulator